MIELQQVCFGYQRHSPSVLRDINLRLPAGQCSGVIGPNGAGKSTLLSLLSGLHRPTSGQILWDGQPVAGDGRALRQQVALVPQDFAFYPQLTVAANLHFFSRLCWPQRQQAATMAATCAADTGLEPYLEQRAGRLSGGQKRRLNIAIGLLKAPRILFLDEPTVGVDHASRLQIIALLNRLKGQGVTLVYTSHLLAEVEQLADQVAILDQGQLSYLGPADGGKPRLELCFDAPLTTAQRTALGPWLAALSNDGRQLQGEVSAEQLPPLLALLATAGISYRQLSLGHNPLQSLYLAALGQEQS